jgi:hypothetical protein
MTNADIAAVVRDLNWLAHRYDESQGAVHFVKLDRQAHRAATFLTEEHIGADLPRTVVRRADALGARIDSWAAAGWDRGSGLRDEGLSRPDRPPDRGNGWLAQHALFARLVERYGPSRVRTLDSATLLERPAEVLAGLSAHFRLHSTPRTLKPFCAAGPSTPIPNSEPNSAARPATPSTAMRPPRMRTRSKK